MRGKPSAESNVVMTEIVLPEDTNPHGHMWGGRLMALIDKAAAIAAIRHCRSNVVTATVDSIVFLAPVRIGHVLHLEARVNAAFRASLEVGVTVNSEDPGTGARARCCGAFVTMVSIDSSGRPQRVPPLTIRTAEDRRLRLEAGRRRRVRLRARAREERARARP